MIDETTRPPATANPPSRHRPDGGDNVVSLMASAGVIAPSLSAIALTRRRAPPHLPPPCSTVDSIANAAKMVIRIAKRPVTAEDATVMKQVMRGGDCARAFAA